MATKFSQFTASATTANTLVVGFDSNLQTNNKYTLGQLATGLSDFIPSFYTGDGTITSDQRRTVTIGGTSSLLFAGSQGGNFSATKLTWPVIESNTSNYKKAVITSTTPITTGMSISGQSGVIVSVTSSGNNYTVENTANFSILPTNLTILYSNNVAIGDKAGTQGIGLVIKPATGNSAGDRVEITDTNGVNILAKHTDRYNNGGTQSRVISIGRGNSDSAGGDRIAINHPFNFGTNLGNLSGGPNSGGTALYIHAGKSPTSGGVYNDCAIRAFGPSKYSTQPASSMWDDSTSSSKYVVEFNNWTGTAANAVARKIFRVANSGRVEIGVPGQYQDQFTFVNQTFDGSIAIPEPVLKVNGQAYTVFHQPSTAITDLTIDWNNSNIQEVTLAASTPTFTSSNPKVGATYILTIKQTGAVTATWTGVKWPADTPPTLSGVDKTDVITLICYDEAANSGAGAYYGSFTLNFTT